VEDAGKMQKGKFILCVILSSVLLLAGCIKEAPSASSTEKYVARPVGTETLVVQIDDQPAAVENIDLEIESFESDKKNYSSRERIVLTARISSSEDAQVLTKVFGIRPRDYDHIKIEKTIALKKGENLITYQEFTPSCTSGCSGVYPGPYEMHIELYFDDRTVDFETIVIELQK